MCIHCNRDRDSYIHEKKRAIATDCSLENYFIYIIFKSNTLEAQIIFSQPPFFFCLSFFLCFFLSFVPYNLV